jgi:transposase
MRYGIYSLAGLVRNELGFDPSSGDVFVFLGKRLNQIRLLQRGDGFAMYVKKLEQGTFEWPKSENIAITSHQIDTSFTGCNAGFRPPQKTLSAHKARRGIRTKSALMACIGSF